MSVGTVPSLVPGSVTSTGLDNGYTDRRPVPGGFGTARIALEVRAENSLLCSLRLKLRVNPRFIKNRIFIPFNNGVTV
jgi:hypothetical protein